MRIFLRIILKVIFENVQVNYEVYFIIIFDNNFLLKKIDKHFYSLFLKIKKHDIFKKHFLVISSYFYLFFLKLFKKITI